MFDITKKRAAETGIIELKAGDGSPLLDEDGNQLSVTVHGPGSKVWQQANSDKSRKQAERMRKQGGKIEAALDNAVPDQVEFLTRITISFNGWEYPSPKDKWATSEEMFRAAYSDIALGFIREHVFSEANDWAGFTKGLAKN